MAYSKDFSNKNDVLRELVDAFGKTLEINTIHSVAKQNGYDARKTKMALFHLSVYNKNNSTLHYSDPRNISFPGGAVRGKISRVPNPNNYLSTFAIEETIDDILKNHRVLILLRGLPGSGKSYLAKSIVDASIQNANHSDHIFSADKFFMKNGKYIYDVTKLDEAHNWAQRNVFKKMLKGCSPIIIDNTNTRLWEMKPYAQMATQCGYKVRILEANTKWCFDCGKLATKNQHGVPKAKIKIMLDRYEKNVTSEALLMTFNFPMRYQTEPHQRLYPRIIENNEPVPSVNSSLNTSAVHNHNSMNQDLKLPDLGKIPEKHLAGVNSQCEVSNIIEISDDDEEANLKVKEIPNSLPKTKIFPSEKIDYSCWGVDEKVLRNWNIVTPLEDDDNVIIVDDLQDSACGKPQMVDQGINTCIEDFHRELKDAKVLRPQYRDINGFGAKSTQNKSGMLDKGCSTQDDICSDRDEDLKKLSDIFQKIPPLYIRDMYDDCNGDFDLTFEIFLEDDKDYSNISYTEQNITHNSDAELDLQPKKFKINDEEQTENLSASSSPIKSPERYSEDLLVHDLTQPSSSRSSGSLMNTFDFPSSSSKTLTEKCSVDDLIMFDSDSDLEFDHSPSQAESDTKSEDNDIIELNLGHTLVDQLEKEFGDPIYDYPKGFQPVVQVPKAFARQLYASYVESVYQQMEAQKCVLDKLVQEDEAFARELFEEENRINKEPKAESFQEIMNEQVAMNIHETEVSQWKNNTPNDLASQLTRKKLFATFPSVNQNTLLEIFHANDRNYEQTVEDLLIAVDPSQVVNDTNMKEPPISEPLLQELQEAQDEYGLSKNDEENRQSQSYRDEANTYLKNRQELYQKAQEYYSRGLKEVAQFYSQLAQKQTQFYEIANNKAATVLLEEHSQRLQNFDTIDLHYLFVKEAIPALDVFIDRNINLLRGGMKKSQNLLVITGRGNRSQNGLSKIKPAVITRLKARKIQYVHLNPGLLKIKVNRNNAMTSDL